MHAVYEPPLWITQETSRANPDFHHGLLDGGVGFDGSLPSIPRDSSFRGLRTGSRYRRTAPGWSKDPVAGTAPPNVANPIGAARQDGCAGRVAKEDMVFRHVCRLRPRH